jgi:hypothetical protein
MLLFLRTLLIKPHVGRHVKKWTGPSPNLGSVLEYVRLFQDIDLEEIPLLESKKVFCSVGPLGLLAVCKPKPSI